MTKMRWSCRIGKHDPITDYVSPAFRDSTGRVVDVRYVHCRKCHLPGFQAFGNPIAWSNKTDREWPSDVERARLLYAEATRFDPDRELSDEDIELRRLVKDRMLSPSENVRIAYDLDMMLPQQTRRVVAA